MDLFYFLFTVQPITLLMSCNRTPLQPTDQITIPLYYRSELLGCVVKPKLLITEYVKILKLNDMTFSVGSTCGKSKLGYYCKLLKKVLCKDEG